VRTAPPLDDRLLEAIRRLDNGALPFAEICRRVGRRAERLGLARPSYETVRAHALRERERASAPGLAEVAVDVAFRARPVTAIVEQQAGTLPPRPAK
jgi:hypothetical protein